MRDRRRVLCAVRAEDGSAVCARLLKELYREQRSWRLFRMAIRQTWLYVIYLPYEQRAAVIWGPDVYWTQCASPSRAVARWLYHPERLVVDEAWEKVGR